MFARRQFAIAVTLLPAKFDSCLNELYWARTLNSFHVRVCKQPAILDCWTDHDAFRRNSEARDQS
jgi:hypothetical protein